MAEKQDSYPVEATDFPQPPWYQAAIWTGADLGGLLRILQVNGWRVSPSYWPACVVDLLFAAANSGLGGVQSLLYGRRVARVELQEPPLFVIGHWRTGTTWLHELLALDPAHTSPTTYQCFVPRHFLLSERFLKSWSSFTLPSERPPDQMRMGWDAPQEDEFALCNLGVPSPYATIAFPNQPPTFMDYLTLEAVTPQQRQRWQRALLSFVKSVQYRHAGRLVLKSPTHTCRLPVLLEMFPEARFIHLVRDPVKVFHSAVRLWKSLFLAHGYQRPRFIGLQEFVLDTFAQMHERLQATRDLVPAGRLLDVHYEDLVQDVEGTLADCYEQLELGDFDRVRPEIRAYVTTHRDYQPNRHPSSREVEELVYQRWQPYFATYGYRAPQAVSASA